MMMPDFRPFLRRLIEKQDRYFALVEHSKLPKCRMCGRHVGHPCHNAERFHTEGPWDVWCRDFFIGSNHE